MDTKIKEGQLLVLTRKVGGCGCHIAAPGTIVQADEDINPKDGYLSFEGYFYLNEMGTNTIPIEAVRVLKPGKERTTAKAKFKKANAYSHASFN